MTTKMTATDGTDNAMTTKYRHVCSPLAAVLHRDRRRVWKGMCGVGAPILQLRRLCGRSWARAEATRTRRAHGLGLASLRPLGKVQVTTTDKQQKVLKAASAVRSAECKHDAR